MTAEELIKRHEGLRLFPYKCSAGKWTVGYGHNLDDNREPVPSGPITVEQAEEMFRRDFYAAKIACMRVVPNFSTLDDVRRAALVDMAFNLGEAGLSTFRKFLGAIAVRDWVEAGRQMLNSRWAGQVGIRATRLVFMVLTGEWE